MCLFLSRSSSQRVYYQDGEYLVSVRYGAWHDLREFITPDDPAVLEVYSQVGQDAWQLFDFVCREISYRHDRRGEFWQLPRETLARRRGDCFTEDTKVLVVNPQGRYESKPIVELEHFDGFQAVSYDLFHQKIVTRPITNFMARGYRCVYRISLRNGTSFKSTLDHRFFSPNRSAVRPRSFRRNQSLLCARKIPPLDWNSHITDNELWLSGIYLAEGYPKQRGSTTLCIANDSLTIQRKVTECLEQLGMPYSPPSRKHHAYITILKPVGDSKAGFVKKRLLQMGTCSLDKDMPDEFLSLSRKQLNILLEGYVTGDGYYPRPSKIGRPRNFATRTRSNRPKPRLEHTTSSTKLAEQIRLAHLILGRPVYTYFQENHGGSGHNPIWRLYENTNSWFNKATLRDLSKVSVRSIEPCGEEPVYDITVDGTHNFLLADSAVLAHNCEDTSLLLCSMLRNFSDAKVTLGNYQGYGHAWCQQNGQILETTYTSARPVTDPQDYCPYCMFNEIEVIELWPGALDDIFSLGRDESTKLNLMARVLDNVG